MAPSIEDDDDGDRAGSVTGVRRRLVARRACGRGRPIDPRGKSSSDPPARARAPAQGLGRPGAARCRTSVHRPGRGGGARRRRKPIDGRRRSHHAHISRCQCHETVEPAEHGTAGSMALGPGTHGSTRLEASSWRLSGRQRVPVGMMERGEGRRGDVVVPSSRVEPPPHDRGTEEKTMGLYTFHYVHHT